MEVAQMPGWARYILGFGAVGDGLEAGEIGDAGGVRKRAVQGEVEGRDAVRARTSVSRLEHS